MNNEEKEATDDIGMVGPGVMGRNLLLYIADQGFAAPGLIASLGYLDGYRSAWLPANLIRAQHGNFGARTYERTDAKGTCRTRWEQEKNHENQRRA